MMQQARRGRGCVSCIIDAQVIPKSGKNDSQALVYSTSTNPMKIGIMQSFESIPTTINSFPLYHVYTRHPSIEWIVANKMGGELL
jgi:hypothetical protein